MHSFSAQSLELALCGLLELLDLSGLLRLRCLFFGRLAFWSQFLGTELFCWVFSSDGINDLHYSGIDVFGDRSRTADLGSRWKLALGTQVVLLTCAIRGLVGSARALIGTADADIYWLATTASDANSEIDAAVVDLRTKRANHSLSTTVQEANQRNWAYL